MKPKREDGSAARSAPARSPRRAGKPSHGAVTREELDAARYIAGMTAKLEAVAIAARLDRLVYFLGRGKGESEIFVRTHRVGGEEKASRGRKRNPTSLQLDPTKRTNRSIENLCGSGIVGSHAQGDAVGQIFDAP